MIDNGRSKHNNCPRALRCVTFTKFKSLGFLLLEVKNNMFVTSIVILIIVESYVGCVEKIWPDVNS